MELKKALIAPSKKINNENKESEIKESIIGKPSIGGKIFNPNTKLESENNKININSNNDVQNTTDLDRYNDLNINYTTKDKKDRNKSTIIDNKIIKNLNLSAFENNSSNKNKRRNSKNISEGIRNMLKILKLDEENNEDNKINKDELKNVKQKIVSNNFKNKNEKRTSDININSIDKKENIKNNIMCVENNFNFGIKKNINNNCNINNNEENKKIEKEQTILNESINKNNNINRNDFEISNVNNVELINKKEYNPEIFEVGKIKDIYYKPNNLNKSNLEKKLYITNENKINIIQNYNKIKQNSPLIIENNNFELKDDNKNINYIEFNSNLNINSEINFSIVDNDITKDMHNSELNNNNSKEKYINNLISNEVNLDMLNNLNENNNNNINNSNKKDLCEIKNINNFSFNKCFIKDNNYDTDINKIQNFIIQKEDNIILTKNNNDNENFFTITNNNFKYEISENNIIHNKKIDINNSNTEKQEKIPENKNISYNQSEKILTNKNSNQIKIKKIRPQNPKNDIEKELLNGSYLKDYNQYQIYNSKIKNNHLNKKKLRNSCINNNLNITKKIIKDTNISYNKVNSSKNKSLCKIKDYIEYKNTSEGKYKNTLNLNIYDRNSKLKKYSIYGIIGKIYNSNNDENTKEYNTSRYDLNSYKNGNININEYQHKNKEFLSKNKISCKNLINISDLYQSNNNTENNKDIYGNNTKPYDIKSTSDESNNNNNICINHKKIKKNNIVSCKNSCDKKKKLKRSSSIKENINFNNIKKSKLFKEQNDNYKNINNNNESNNLKNKKQNLEKIKNDIKVKLISNIDENKNSEINEYDGPIDIKYISLKNYEQTMKDLIKKIKMLKYKYTIIDFNLFKCTRGIKTIFIEIVKLKKGFYYYLITNDKKNLRHKKNKL